MTERERGLEDIREIRSMMEKSSKFLSLSGLSGILAGLLATAGAAAVNSILVSGDDEAAQVRGVALVAVAVLVLTFASSAAFSYRLARKRGHPVWGSTAKHLLLELGTPLVAGGMFCLILLMNRMYPAIPGTMLVFYGVALAAAAKLTRDEVRYLGWVQITLGMLAFIFVDHALLYWAVGFGIVHILYGGLMYFKYEL